MDRSIEPLDGDGPDVLISRRESAVMISDVSRDICVEPDQLPVVVSEEVVGPLAFTAVDLTRSQGSGALVVARPADDERISQVEVDQDLLSGQIMKSVDPDKESGDQTSLNVVPIVDGDACHAEWQETVVADAEMEKFVLIPEVCPVVSMTSAAETTFGPVLSEVVGSELPAVFLGKVAFDRVGLGVGPSCLRVDSEETLLALMDERGVVRFTVLGVTLDGGPMEGAPVLEPIEHSVLGKSLDGGQKVGMPVLEPLEHSVLAITMNGGPMEGAPVLEPIEHSVLENSLDSGPMEGMTLLEPLEHSVLAILIHSEPMVGAPVLEPLEHSVLEKPHGWWTSQGDIGYGTV